MSYYRLVLDYAHPHLVDEAGTCIDLIQALRAKKVSVEHETNFRFLDGHYGPLYYMRLSPRPIGGHFCAPLQQFDAERFAAASGIPIKRYQTPIPGAEKPVEAERVETAQIHLTTSHFKRLPVLEEIDEPEIPDGYWARRADADRCIAIREGGAWVDRAVVFEHR